MYMYNVYILGIRYYTKTSWWWSCTIRHDATSPKTHLKGATEVSTV